MQKIARLRIYCYKDKIGRFYKLAYFDNKQCFIHIKSKIIKVCNKGIDKKGRKYIEYNGSFEYENGVIIVWKVI